MIEKKKRMSAKICLFGDSAVGKTCLIRRYVKNEFDDKYITTIGTNISKKKITVNHPMKNDTEVEVSLMIWDIMGQKGFRHLLQEAYFDGASGAIGVCDVTRRETFTGLEEWMTSLIKVAGDIPIVLLGNKSDLTGKASVTLDEIKELSLRNIENGWREDLKDFINHGREPNLLSSAKTGENVEIAFARLAEMVI